MDTPTFHTRPPSNTNTLKLFAFTLNGTPKAQYQLMDATNTFGTSIKVSGIFPIQLKDAKVLVKVKDGVIVDLA